jgi:hypothetical protein
MKTSLVACVLLGGLLIGGLAPAAWSEEAAHSGGAANAAPPDKAPAPRQGSSGNGAGGAATASHSGGETGHSGSAEPGGGRSGVHADNPIDTRIAEPPRGNNQSSLPGNRWRPMGRTANPSGATLAAPRPFHLRHSKQNEVATSRRNAIGAVHDPAGGTITSGRTAIGIGTHSGDVGPRTPSGNAAVAGPGKIGGSPNTGQSYIGAAARLPGTPATNRATINGTGMTRVGSGPSTLGGPAKATGINGTGIRAKH